MKLTFALLSGLLATSVAGSAIPNASPEAEAAALAEPEAFPESLAEPVEADDLIARATSDADILKAAAKGWAFDTGIVSGFLDAVAAKKFTSTRAFVIAAKAAYVAEVAEWAFKEILAEYLLTDQGCQASNSTLTTNDTWERTKDYILQLTELDWKKDQTAIQDIVKKINFGDGSALGRCNAILPAFDVFFAAADKKLQQLRPGDKSLVGLKAVRPKACAAVKTRDVLEAEE